MPPKGSKVDKGQQKALEKQKLKIAEDKTFGLKNKNKSKQVQKYIKGVQQSAKGQSGVSDHVLREKDLQQKEEKKKQQQQNALLASLFKGTENVKKITISDVRKTDPKSIKAEQLIDVYTDQREQKKNETMADWDQEKLEEVIKTKHGETATAKATDIVCKHFLDAVEKKQYGWFWTCPNGGYSCKYRHCLPPGYVLKKEVPKTDEDEEGEPIEEIIERERAALPGGGEKVTLESFKRWKEEKERARAAAVEASRLAESKRSGGSGLAVLSGRDLFTYDPSLFVDDVAAAGEDDYQEEEGYWEGVINANQATLDAANAAASTVQETMGTKSSDNAPSSSSCIAVPATAFDASSKKHTLEVNKQTDVASKPSEVIVQKASLFLESDVPNIYDLEE